MVLRLNEKTRLLLLFMLLSATKVNGQRYTNWFFGSNASISFEPNSFPIPHRTTGSLMISSEASCAISNNKGEVLFYTNGETVYNRFHEIMLNGSGLDGNESATQGALIIPMPGNDSLYYIFTADAIENHFGKGYRYSVVNMNRDGGKGEVTAKNNILEPRCTERLTAVRHADGINVWIITNDLNSNVFKAHLLTCRGIQPAVVSTVGEVLNSNEVDNMGYMKISPDGKKFCQTHFIENDLGTPQHSFFQLFDFDNVTGQITNPLKISLPNSNAFGCEFSANSQFLYLTDPQAQEIDQVECTLPRASAIESSVVSLPSNFGYYAIQAGPDDKIYATRGSNALTVIDQPDKKGISCLLRENAIDMIVDTRIGLPPVLRELKNTSNNFSFTNTDSCRGVIQFAGQSSLVNAQWEWDFGDGTTSNQQNPVHSFNPANRMYVVSLKITSPSVCGSIVKYKYIVPKGILAKADFNFEGKCDSGYVKFTNSSHHLDSVQFLWSFGDGSTSSEINPVHAYSTSGVYQVKLLLTTPGSCMNDSISKTLNLDQLDIQASPDQTIFEGQSVQLGVTGNGTSFAWDPPSGLNNSNTKNPVASPLQSTTYFVTGTNNSGCSDVDSVHVIVKTYEDIHVPSAFTPNNDRLNDTFRPVVGIQFRLVKFSVYNRWGELVFSSTEKNKGWDGNLKDKQQASGLYLWSIEAVNKQGKAVNKKGTVLLIR